MKNPELELIADADDRVREFPSNGDLNPDQTLGKTKKCDPPLVAFTNGDGDGVEKENCELRADVNGGFANIEAHSNDDELKVKCENKEAVNDDCNSEERRIKHYSNKQKILLVGEGDFSFAACLATAFRRATNLTATSRDTRETVVYAYSGGERNLRTLEEHGATVHHGVDAHTMNKHPELEHKLFDRIIFNFPHSGEIYGREHESWNIVSHQKLVTGFFKAAAQMLDWKGEIHVTHKTASPFDKWDVEKLAKDAGLMLAKQVGYYRWEYPGYVNRKAYGKCWDATFPVGECSTFMLSKGNCCDS